MPCIECGKKFRSWKALHGHMRCDPERRWRDINPSPIYRRSISPIQDQQEEEEEAVMSAEDHEVAASLLLLSKTDDHVAPSFQEDVNYNSPSSCKKVFGSHLQALGGHRATHKNVKGCFAIATNTSNGEETEDDDRGDVKGKNKKNMIMVSGHKCSVCLRVFSSGQALGGHKRRHREKGEDFSSSSSLVP